MSTSLSSSFYRYHVQFSLRGGDLRTYSFSVFTPFDLAKVVNRTGSSLHARLAYVFDVDGVYMGSQVIDPFFTGYPSDRFVRPSKSDNLRGKLAELDAALPRRYFWKPYWRLFRAAYLPTILKAGLAIWIILLMFLYF